LTAAGDVVAVATPGHTTDHISVLVECDGTTYFLAGDTSYDERLMLAGRIDGVSADDDVARATLGTIKRFTHTRPTVYLPTHDPESAIRLASRRVVEHPDARGTAWSDATRSVAALGRRPAARS
jgi:N-acyl homoserine lactone hydrolase